MTARRKLVKPPGSSADRMARSAQMRMHGHPLMAGLITAMSVGAFVVNQFLEETDYKCPICNATKTRVEGT